MAATGVGAGGALRARRAVALSATTTQDRAVPSDDADDVDADGALSPATAHALLTAASASSSSTAASQQKQPHEPPGPKPRIRVRALLGHVALVAAAAYGVANVEIRTPTAVWAIVYYLVCGFSYTAGYHRHYAHRSFQATWLLRLSFMLFGSANFMGPLLTWCRDHRAHHRNADSPKDPFNRQQGFLYAYLGCRVRDIHTVGDADISDLRASRLVTVQSKIYLLIAVVFGWLLPAAVASLWDDFWGGLVYAGLVRTVLFMHGQYLLWALGHTYGHQPYSDNHSGRNNTLLSILSLGEGYLNFHREFPGDYRMGCFYYHMDATKWFLRLLSVLRLAYGFQKTPYSRILLVRVQRQLGELEKLRTTINFGPNPDSLPEWTMDEFRSRVEQGEQLMILDSIAHDVKDFLEKHPGGAEVMLPKIGKDATVAFNGGVQRHSKAARNLAALMRVAVVKDAAELRRGLRARDRGAKSPPPS